MKKTIKYIIFVLLVGVIFGSNIDVYAFDISSEIGVRCEYGEYYFEYFAPSSEYIFSLEDNFDDLGINVTDGRPFDFITSTAEQKWLKSNNVIVAGSFSCPSDPFGSDLGAATNKECGLNGCATLTYDNDGSIFDYDENGCPTALRPIIFFIKKLVFNTLQLFIPIILILMGTIDLVKATITSDDKSNKDSISKFIKRVLAAVFMFFIVTIVTVVMDMFANTDVGAKDEWKACWNSID